MSEQRSPDATSPDRPKRRKLKHPRASNACNFCRRRKVRCSGDFPCVVCVREEVSCEYASGHPPSSISIVPDSNNTVSLPFASAEKPRGALNRTINGSAESTAPGSILDDAVVSRRNSIDPPQTFMHSGHVGPTSGISFLYGQWVKGPTQEEGRDLPADEGVFPYAPLTAYGDIPQTDSQTRATLPKPIFTNEQILDLLDRYFQYISPTYRYHHHPTIKMWALAFVQQDRQLTAAQKSCVLIVCAQTLLHGPTTPGVSGVGKGDHPMSVACFDTARYLLDKEPGPPSLASVQARIGMCLYLLSTFRLNECRYCFSFAVTIATALGIQRRLPKSSKINIIDAECRKRAFWSSYVLDGYLSVMLGRPRLLRDEDIDQPFPLNIADNDLVPTESIETLPRHGNLEAFIAHAKLAQLLARGNDQLYPLHSVANDQLLQRSNNMLDALSGWENALPEFLKPRSKTLTGQRTFERQNTILKLAVSHVRILVTRRCLLIDFGKVKSTGASQNQDLQAKRATRECISAIVMILDAVESLINDNQCYGSFWSTQYVALVGISTLYVLLIQGSRHALPGDMESFLNVDECFQKARRCHDHLATLPPPESQAQRHHALLSHLRSKADKSLTRSKNQRPSTRLERRISASATLESKSGPPHLRTASVSKLRGEINSSTQNVQEAQAIESSDSFPYALERTISGNVIDNFNDNSLFSAMLTPNSNSDTNFQHLLDFGWESLDTIGANMRGADMYYFDSMP